MKKNILSLIIAPLFIHAANAASTDVIPLPSNDVIGEPLFEFSPDRSIGDREVGISELKQVTEHIGTRFTESNEIIKDIKKNSDEKDDILEKKITHTHQVATSTRKLVDTFIDDAGKKIVPEHINRMLPDAIKSELSPLEARTEFLENKTEDINTKTNSMTMLFNEIPVLIKQEFETHQSDVDTQIERLRNISHLNDINSHEEKRNAASTKVVTQALLGATEELETDVDKLKNKVRAVELQAGFAKHSAYTSEKDIRENKNQLSTQSRDIAKNKKLLESAKVVTSVITDATLALEGDVDKLNTRISNASKKINTTTNIANQNTRDIAQQKVKVEKNTLDILKNRQDLRSLEKDLRETNERLDNGLAASAALNGLFQPYGVGKLNITAAVGGYQSTQAVAVGTGYRFNENIAVKTGMAYTGSNDVMYNMAVNLEW
ncbi:YadA-like family protein [Morganella sp. Je.2.23]|uniref:YadA C-terminal domain-containing protein n=1 Tax=Morganella sp. Je.2.23 TaxID=3142840 RepID=UPI003DA9BBF7